MRDFAWNPGRFASTNPGPAEFLDGLTCKAVTSITLKWMEISRRLEPDQIEAMLKKRNPAETMLSLYSKI